MNKYKIEILEKKIKREVEHFHPLLKELFNRMIKEGNLRQFAHTHGTEEYGADFILQQEDGFGTISTIGIVVKNGSINANKKSAEEIERQVRQCFSIARDMFGNKNVYITKVYVFTNGTVSNNVKKTVKGEHHGKIVEFMEQEYLVQMLDKYYPIFWEDIDGDLAEFINNTQLEISKIDARSSLYATDQSKPDVYITPRITERDDDKKSTSKKSKSVTRKIINLNDTIEHSDICLLQSGMGGGKSKLLRRIAVEYSTTRSYQRTSMVPIFISYIELSETYGSDLESLVYDKFNSIKEHMPNIIPLILIDGIDEKMLDVDSLEAEYENICKQSKKLKYKIVLSSRYMGEFEYVDCGTDSLSVRKCHIEPLNIKELIELIKMINSKLNITQKLIEDMENSSLFQDMKRTPIVGEILARILQNDRAELPSNLPELYQKYTEIVLGRWDVTKNILADKEYYVIETLTKELARDFIDNERDFVTFEEFESLFDEYVSKRSYEFSGKELVGKLMKRSTFFYFDIPKKQVVFKHRSFVEFFYAVHKNNNGGLEIDNRAFNPYWTNIVFFYLGIRRDCSKELNTLVRLKPNNPIIYLSKFINFSNFILASYDTPHDELVETIKSIIIEISEHANDTLDMKVKDSPFVKMPRVIVSTLFAFILLENYSYDFIGKKLRRVYDQIQMDTNLDDKNLVFSGYIISLLATHLGDITILKDYLRTYRTKLPLEIKLIIDADSRLPEYSTIYEKDDDIKKVLKSIRRNIKSQNASLMNQIKSTPLLEVSKK